MADSQPLFEGQTTHPLSDAEREAFFKKMNISGRWFTNDNEFIRSALEAIIQTPTGAAQAREILSSSWDRFNIICNRSYDGPSGVHQSGTNNIHINKNLLKDPRWFGETTLHECLHARQDENINTITDIPTNRVLVDAEPQALSAQLNYETKYKAAQDLFYNKSFEINYKKWLDIANHPQKKPKNALGFKPLTSNIDAAKKAYAYEMASRETQAQYIKDFLRPSEDWGNHALPHTSYRLLWIRETYEETSIANKAHLFPTELISRTIERHKPFLSQTDFTNIQKKEQILQQTPDAYTHFNDGCIYDFLSTLDNAPQNYRDESFQKKLLEIKKHLKKDIYKRPISKILQKIKRGQSLSSGEKSVIQFSLIKNSQMDKESKIKSMIRVIDESSKNPVNNKFCNWMIKDLGDFIGTDIQITQQNEGNVRGTLRDASRGDITPPVGKKNGREGLA